MLLITCSCGQRMKVPAEALGKTATCVRCGERMKITVETADPSEPGLDSTPTTGRSAGQIHSGSDPIHVLRQHGLIDARAIDEATLVQRDLPRKLWDLLIDLGYVSTVDFHAIMAKQQGIASIDLPNYHVPREVLDLVPAEIAHRGVLIPVDRLGRLLTLAMACPLDSEVIEEVEHHTGLRVKAMLCGSNDLKEAINRHYAPQAEFDAEDDPLTRSLLEEFGPLLECNEVARRVFALDALAPFSDTLEQLKVASNDSDREGSLQTITEIIAADPVATSLLLRVSNSEAYGFARRVDGLGLACSLLGSKAMHAVVSSVPPAEYDLREDEFNYKDFLDRAQFCSEAAQSIANAMDSQVAITAYTAALLHEIGRLALLETLPRSYPRLTAGKNGRQRTAIEDRVYHLTTAEAGYLLARKWNLPYGITEPIRYQRAPENAQHACEVTTIVALAVVMADAFENGDGLKLDQAESIVLKLGLSRPELGEIFRETSASMSGQPTPAL